MGRLAPGQPTIGEIALNLIRDGQGRLVTRLEMAQALHGPHATVENSAAVIRQAIIQARALLGPLPADRYQIVTRHKRGWVWRPRRHRPVVVRLDSEVMP